MSSLARTLARFWSGSGKKEFLNRYPPPWPNPPRPRFGPTPPPKPTTLAGKIKSYIPGRRWLIFGGVIVSWISLAAYDKRERRAAVARWCKKVEHLSRRQIEHWEDIPSVGVWVSAPPGDQLKWNKEVWRDYIKPVIIAAGFDYSLHLSPKAGLTRTALRELILQHRLQRERPAEQGATRIRDKEGGDVVIVGRNTLKDVVRGIHEGYLLPPDDSPPSSSSPSIETEAPEAQPDLVAAAVPTSQYSSLDDPSPSTPEYTFTYVPSLHILGLRHTPRRIYRFLTRRYIADEICEQVVACILNQPQREWSSDDCHHGETEETYWPKTVKPDSEWRDGIVVDPRLQPKLFWRVPSPTGEVPDYREASAPDEGTVRVEELVPTEEELSREEGARTESRPGLFAPPHPFNRT